MDRRSPAILTESPNDLDRVALWLRAFMSYVFPSCPHLVWVQLQLSSLRVARIQREGFNVELKRCVYRHELKMNCSADKNVNQM